MSNTVKMLFEDIFKPVDYGGGVFPLVKWCFVSYVGVDSLEYLFTYSLLAGLISLQVGLLAKFSM